MKIGIVTNLRSPYRKLQIEEISKNSNWDISVYYTNKNILGRSWDVDPINNVKEIPLKGFKLSRNHGNLNFGLLKIILENDVILIGGYEKPTYIVLSLLARLFKKPYIIIYDGISPKRILGNEHKAKYLIKKMVISGATAIFGNGIVSSKYFCEKFNFKSDRVFNQCLTVDIESIKSLLGNSDKYREELRERYQINSEKKVLIYSGRLIKRKNVDKILLALNQINNKEKYELLILGDGEERESLIELAKQLNVNLQITGFIANQTELFKHYFVGDVLILPSNEEPWGLVINEAMAAGLPIISSDECGASLDLVKDYKNGFVIPAGQEDVLKEKIAYVFENNLTNSYGKESKKIISQWSFTNSANNFHKMIEFICERDTRK
ncbi:glycosyltransferase family 4 protein [Bacillus cereus]|uniref:glycosyltransferase family 4 protein n=1 Tax=Bacillus cereus TaxID=1396 RepID=UPI00027BF325|nr:glycosyltransferase family 4 protein [Bacillus cereus]EJV64234.1 hypothetical protein IEM_02734 [Bacillus cereus BAG6O-2]